MIRPSDYLSNAETLTFSCSWGELVETICGARLSAAKCAVEFCGLTMKRALSFTIRIVFVCFA